MGAPNVFVPLALLAFPLFVAACFSALPPRRAVLTALLGGWLFLPHFDSVLKVFVFGKSSMVATVVLLGSLAFDSGRWSGFRLRLLDLPILLLCTSPFATALQNGLGGQEALSAMASETVSWAPAYLLGRVYLGRPRGLRDYATALVAAALVYVPLCLWEARMSPQLHANLYGFRPWYFDQSVRYGGYRPAVFMQHGLALGMFMAICTLVVFWLWRTSAVKEVWRIPVRWALAVLAVTTVLCKSTGAIVLLVVGMAALEVTRRFQTAALLLLLAAVPPAYYVARISGWDANEVVDLARAMTNEARTQSLEFRIHNENILMRRAMLRPWLGWGRFGRAFVYDEETGEMMTTADGMWIIYLGCAGLMGLIALTAVLMVPALGVVWTSPARLWSDARLAPAAVLALALLLWNIDDISNSMPNPLTPAAAGALVTFVLLMREPKKGTTTSGMVRPPSSPPASREAR